MKKLQRLLKYPHFWMLLWNLCLAGGMYAFAQHAPGPAKPWAYAAMTLAWSAAGLSGLCCYKHVNKARFPWER